MLLVDVVAVVQSGSYWMTYLVVLVPPVALATACCSPTEPETRSGPEPGHAASSAPVDGRRDHPRPRRLHRGEQRDLTGGLVGDHGGRATDRSSTTRARRSAGPPEPGDTLVVYGGRADIQWASGLRRRTPTCGPCRCAPWTPTSPSWATCSPDRPRRRGSSSSRYLDTWSETGTGGSATSCSSATSTSPRSCGQYRVYHLKSLERPVLESRLRPRRSTRLGRSARLTTVRAVLTCVHPAWIAPRLPSGWSACDRLTRLAFVEFAHSGSPAPAAHGLPAVRRLGPRVRPRPGGPHPRVRRVAAAAARRRRVRLREEGRRQRVPRPRSASARASEYATEPDDARCLGRGPRRVASSRARR